MVEETVARRLWLGVCKGQHLARTRLAQSNWIPTVSGIRHHEYKFEKGYELGVWAHASPQTDGKKGEERRQYR